MINLLKTNDGWIVDDGAYTFAPYDTIEKAAEHLINCKVEDDEIDEALIDMALSNKNKAIFENGKFKESVNTNG